MTKQPDSSDQSKRIRSFVKAAREFCEFVEDAPTVKSVERRLNRGRAVLARLCGRGDPAPR